MPKPVYCVGGAAIDRKLQAQATLALATSNPITTAISYGGVARNVAQNLSHWTNSVYLQTLIGADSAGRELINYMKKLGVNTRETTTLANSRTAEYTAICQPDGELFIALAEMDIFNFFSEQHIAAWDNWQNQGIIFLDTNLPAHIIPAAIVKSATKKMLLCIDPVSAFKAKRLPLSLENIFLLKPNKFEAEALTGISINKVSDAYQAGSILLDRGVNNVVISLGADGFVLTNYQQQQHVPIVQPLGVVDVNGAGDAFIAGILFGLQQGADIMEACQFGMKAASFIVQTKESALSAQ